MKKRVIAICVILVMLLISAVPACADTEEVKSGTVENMIWSLEDGVLTISGTGPMPDIYSTGIPWALMYDEINKIVIEKGITSIATYAFAHATEVTSVTIPSTVKVINNTAFYRNKKLKSITIPEGVVAIDTGVFSQCESLTTVKLPSTLKGLGRAPFEDCPSLKTLTIASANPYWKCENGLIISSDGKYLNSAIGAIEGKAVIPSGVINIGIGAFYKTNISQVVLPSTLKGIGAEAFNACPNLKLLDVPKGVCYVGDWFFGLDSHYGYPMEDVSVKCMENSAAASVARFREVDIVNKTGTPAAIHKDQDHTFTTKTILKASISRTGLTQEVCSVCGYHNLMKQTDKLTPTIKLSSSKKSITKGSYYTLTVTYKYGDSIKSIGSSNREVAVASKVSTGKYKIKALKRGKATITVKLKSGLSKKLYVTVI